MKKRTIFQIIYAILILCLFYYLKVPLKIIGIFALLILAVLLLKGPLYKNIEKTLTNKIKFLSKINPKFKKAIIIIVFILVFILIKQFIFFILTLFGIDVQTALTETINNIIIE